MSKIIITAGAEAADIDVFACAVAYAELLRLQGNDAIAAISGSFTMSVTPSILEWNANFERGHNTVESDNFVIVDISDHTHLPAFVDVNKVVEIYDHRYGFEEFWKSKIPQGTHIEMVGSCGTLIWEEFKKRGFDQKISPVSAKLLLASIVSNTLNFKVSITTERDIKAYDELCGITGLDNQWISEYFEEQEGILIADFKTYLKTDTKTFKTPLGDFVIAQIELWDASQVIETKTTEIQEVMQEYQNIPWILNIPNISQGFNYIYSTSEPAQMIMKEKLGIEFTNNIAKTKKLIMRKEIVKILITN